LQEGAGQALLLEAELGEEVAAAIEGFGLGGSAMDGGVVRSHFVGLFVKAQGEEIVFHGADAVEAPAGVGDGLDGFGFEQTLRLELSLELSAVLLIGGEIVFLPSSVRGPVESRALARLAASRDWGICRAPFRDRTPR
jgi:hypothetical protein